MISSYPSIFNLGHRLLGDLFDGPVVIQEKIDGSQISFGVTESGLSIRSKGTEINIDAPDKMFAAGVEVIKSLESKLFPNLIYRGEYLRVPKHNAMTYGRIPTNHIILFDVATGVEDYVSPVILRSIAIELGLEAVPTYFHGVITNREEIEGLLSRESVLDTPEIEGVVIKNYGKFGPDHKVLMGKLVRAEFRELHKKEWGEANPTGKDIIDRLADLVRTEKRWEKAVQHLRDAGALEQTPRDIGKLVVEVPKDIEKEAKELLQDELWNWAWPHIRRKSVAGLAEWYKQTLVDSQFGETHV